MGQIVKLVPDAVSKETIDTLSALLQEARAGKIIGVAYVALHKGRHYSADNVGEGRPHSLLMRVALQELSDYLGPLFRK